MVTKISICLYLLCLKGEVEVPTRSGLVKDYLVEGSVTIFSSGLIYKFSQKFTKSGHSGIEVCHKLGACPNLVSLTKEGQPCSMDCQNRQEV